MQFSFFVGIDVSKNSLDFAVRNQQKLLFHTKVENNEDGLQQFKEQCQDNNVELKQSLFCCEHTGIYSQILLSFASQHKFSLWLESSMRIKRSMGLQRAVPGRDKSDQIDAMRICEYTFRHADQAAIWQPERAILIRLKQLVALRKRFITTKNALKVPLQEVSSFQDKKLNQELQKLNQKPIEALNKQIQEVEKKIRTLVKEDNTLAHLFELVTSVDGIGEVVFWEMVTTTNEFRLFSCPRKFACYAGVAPFEHSSGISIRGKTRVSHLANKQMKKLLHMAAMSAVAAKGELADYYQRKVGQGKAKMAVLNAVRNKIIHRVFACVREDRKYEKNYNNVLA